MLPARPLGPRSSLLSHSFPSFYACYLLKSIKTPQSTTVYIGSTPSPPRRIRQHNGELTQGARKTRSKRPWVMHMIVYGFPSRLAALQFEWAWQHPHKSRHLRDANGSIFGIRGSKLLKKNIAIVRTMVSKHPFNTWPLHVKLFTEEAVQCWRASANIEPPLPLGFTCSMELEGVDGKSGHPGSGRQGPIAVNDADFTHALLAKNNTLLVTGGGLECSICQQSIENYSSEHLTTALCPFSNCVAVSHLTCLSQDLIKESSGTTEIIPRGGYCKSCHNYILWGDIVRGCYRRLPPVNGNEHPDMAIDDMYLSDEDEGLPSLFSKEKKNSRVRPQSTPPSKSPLNSWKGKERAIASQSSEGELFDFTNLISSSDSEETPIKRKPGRPRKDMNSPHRQSPISEGQILLQSPNVTKRQHRKKVAVETPVFFTGDSVNIVDITSGSEVGGIDVSRTPTRSKGKAKEKGAALTSSEGETFDLDIISSNSGSDSAKRRPGRPRKPGLKNPNTGTPSSSSNAVKRMSVRPRTLDAQSPKTGAASSPSIKYTSSAKRMPRGPHKLGLSYLAAPPAVRIGSPKCLIPSLSSKPPILLESQALSSPESNQGVVERRPGRPRKDSFATCPPISNSYHPPNSLEREAAPESTAYESDRRPKFREYDLGHSMSNLVLTTSPHSGRRRSWRDCWGV